MARPKTLALADWLQEARKHWEEFLLGRVAGRTVGRRLHRFVIAVFLVGRGFIENRGPTRAAALSYTTLLALVPLLAVMLSVSKNLIKETSVDLVPKLIDRAVALVAPQLELIPLGEAEYGPPAPGQAVLSSHARAETVARIQSFIDGIDAGKLGTIGTIFLVVIAIRLLTTIETAFNDIWGVTKGRSVWRKVVYYWSTITLGPLLILLAMYMTGKLEYLRAYEEFFGGVPWLKRFMLGLTPFVMLWLAFTAIYALMPNTHVSRKAAFIGGVVGGTLWQLNTLLNTLYISRVLGYSALYGSIGIIPVFLVGLYLSWLIILFGAQVSFAAQNIHAYLQKHATDRIDQAGRERIACRMMLLACDHFLNRLPPPSLVTIADRLQVPTQLLNLILARLHDAGLLAEVAEADGGVVPIRAPATVRVTDVLSAMRTRPEARETAAGDDDLIAAVVDELVASTANSPANATYAELVQRSRRATAG